MTPEKQRIAIAEACGWKRRTTQKWEYEWMNPETLWSEPEPPDYLNDLNAMHESVNALSLPQKADFAVFLNKLIGMETNICGWIYLINATAVQRAEAFLKTLNLWEEETQL